MSSRARSCPTRYTAKDLRWRTATSSRRPSRSHWQGRATSSSPNRRRIWTGPARCSERVGFKLDFGDDGTGWQFKYLTRGGGYYFNVGCSDLIVEGEIGLVQFSDIAGFVAEGASMRTGETLAADLIVLATGYKGPGTSGQRIVRR